MEVVARDGRPLVIVAEEIEGQLLAALIVNNRDSDEAAEIDAVTQLPSTINKYSIKYITFSI